jgi:polyhydroxybutyrate depolymerase
MARDRRFRSSTLVAAVLLAFAVIAGGCGPGAADAGRSGADEAGPSASASASLSAAPSASASPSASPRPPEAPGPGDHTLALDHAGTQVEYEVHAPPAFRPGKKLPLVVAVHYWGGDVETMRQMTRLDATADREGFLVAYPCCDSAYDVKPIRAIVAHLVAAWRADPDRVYATGMSAGAQTALDLAIDAPGVFAAVAPVSGGFLQTRGTDDSAYRPSRPVSLVSFFGSQDRAAPTIKAGLGRWREGLRCGTGPAVWVDAGKTISRTSTRCADGSDVVVYAITGMGHSWPGGADVGLGAPRVKLNATDLIWEFFAAHRLRR